MLFMHHHTHQNAISAGARVRVNAPATPTTWFFATEPYGERPTGAPPL